MLLVVGASFVRRLANRYAGDAGQVAFRGRPGARIQDDGFRQWAIQAVAQLRPAAVLLCIGGNDTAMSRFRVRQLIAAFDELVAGILAGGAAVVFLLPIPPRTTCRPQDATVGQYRARRKLANMALRRRFRAPEARCVPVGYPTGFLGSDGVHPSESGQRWLLDVIHRCGGD